MLEKGILGFAFLTGPIAYYAFGQLPALVITGSILSQKAMTYAVIREGVNTALSKALSTLGMSDVLDQIAMKKIANRLYFRFVTDTMHLLPKKRILYCFKKIMEKHSGIKQTNRQ